MRKNTAIQLAALAVTLLIIVGIVYVGVPYVFGCDKPFMVVVSGSMEPTIHVNDMIIVKGVNPYNIKVGDIIVFRSPINPKMLIVHRVIDIVKENNEIFFKTKGDHNPAPDPWLVSEENVVGKVIFIIPYIGIIARVLMENPLLKISFILLIIFLIVYIEYKDMVETKTYEDLSSN